MRGFCIQTSSCSFLAQLSAFTDLTKVNVFTEVFVSNFLKMELEYHQAKISLPPGKWVKSLNKERLNNEQSGNREGAIHK